MTKTEEADNEIKMEMKYNEMKMEMKHENDYDHAVERGSYDLRTGLVTKCVLEKRQAEGRRAGLMERKFLKNHALRATSMAVVEQQY